MGAVAVVAVIGAALAVSAHRRHAGLVSGLAYAGVHRTFLPRLSIETKFQPCELAAGGDEIVAAECRGAEPDAPGDGLVALQHRISAAAEAGDPEGIHADALVDLVWGERSTEDIERVVQRLRQVVRADTAPGVDLLADLSGALLIQAGRKTDPMELFEAVDVAEQALERDSANLPALYNHALALDELSLNDEASKAWRVYLRSDSSSGWAGEARRRIEALRWSLPPEFDPSNASDSALSAFAVASPQKARTTGWRVMLARWGDALLRGAPAAADSALHAAEVIGAALARRPGGDATLAEAVRVIRSRGGNAVALRRLAQAHVWYSEGDVAFTQSNLPKADSLFTHAREADAGSPALVAWSDVGRANALGASDVEAAIRVAREAVNEADSARTPALAGMAYLTLGVQLVKAKKTADAAAAYARAAQLLNRSAEERNAASAASNSAEAERILKNTRDAYARQYDAALILRTSRASVALQRVFENTARWLAEDGLGRAAARLSDEAVAVSARTDVPFAVVEARDLRAEGLARRGETDAALAEVRAAEALLPRLDPAARAFSSAMLDATWGIAMSRTNALEAVERLNGAIPVISKGAVPLRLITALLARADALARLGRIDAARADTNAALDLIAEMARDPKQGRLPPEEDRDARGTINRVVARMAGKQPGEALDLFERGLAALRTEPPVSLPAVPPGRVVVRYALVGDSLLAWTLAPGRDPRVAITHVRAGELAERVRHAAEALAERDPDAALPELQALYDVLIRPIAGELGPPETEIVIVPDGVLGAVPYAALRDRATRRYLVEDHPVRLAQMLAMATAPSDPWAEGGARTAAVVLDPAFDPQLNPHLARLPGAGDEFSWVAAWASARPAVVADTAATVERVSALLGKASVLHFAGHAVADPEIPDSSYLVLANGRRGGGRLSAAAIAGMELQGVQLVVLSACSTLNDTRGAGGFTGLGGAFLHAGARGVIGSLWSVDDHRTSELMREFYREFRLTPDPAMALRQAQRAMLRSPEPGKHSPAAWAGFEYAGW